MAIDTRITSDQLSAAENLFKLAGVVGYSAVFQQKIIKDKMTDQPCIRVYVKRKLPRSLCVLTRRLIPKTIDSIVTDVVDVQGQPIFLSNESPIYTDPTTDPKARHRPVVGGISTIGPWGGIDCVHESRRSAGTVTITALNENNDPRSLSCYHVWNNSGPDELCAEREDPLIQPGGIDGGRCMDDVFCTLDKWKDLVGASGQEEFDSATGKPTHASMVKVGEVLGAGQVTAFRNPKRTDRPSLYGRSSKVIHNIFFPDLYGTFRVQGYGCRSGKFYCYFRNVALFSPPCIGGDSGAPLIVREGDKLILLAQAFAGTQGISIAAKIEPIFTYFKLHLPPGNGNGNGEEDIVSVQLTLTAPTGPTLHDMTRGTGNEWNGSVALTADGTHTLKFVATSRNGNTGSKTITIKVENGLPPFVTVKVITPTDGATVKKGELLVKVEATYEGQY